MAIDKRQRLIEFFVDKLPLCEFEHVPIRAHFNFDLSRPGLFFTRGYVETITSRSPIQFFVVR